MFVYVFVCVFVKYNFVLYILPLLLCGMCFMCRYEQSFEEVMEYEDADPNNMKNVERYCLSVYGCVKIFPCIFELCCCKTAAVSEWCTIWNC